MRKIFLAVAVVTALALGGWAAYGTASHTDLAAASDREAMEAVGGQTIIRTCYVTTSELSCEQNGCISGSLYALTTTPYSRGAWNTTIPKACTTACGKLCGGSTNTPAYCAP